ncbi:MAG: S1 RNA-binding domain-containing protein [Candidatus Izemoplasmatales bacterium]|nr:S1 RNA-binding domain-containing protein [Candidatus Izemoplasmatales bacterium]
MENMEQNIDTIKNVKEGDIVKGIVVRVDDEEVLVDVGYIFEGTIYKDHLSTKKVQSAKDLVKVGDEIEAQITKLAHGDDNNIMLLSRRDLERRQTQAKYREDIKVEHDIIAKVKKNVKGGLILDYHSIEIFLPESLIQLDSLSPEDKAAYVGKDITVRIIDIRQERNKERIIANKKTVDYERLKNQEKAEIQALNVGDIVKGKVKKIMDFGAFIELSELIEGLIHISELSHYHVKKVEEVLNENDEVECKIIKISGRRISLSIRALQEHPWDLFLKNHKVGDKVEGKIVKKMQFGMLVEIERDVTGLLARADYSWDPNDNLAGRVNLGDLIEVEITSISAEKKQFSLSKKHLDYNPWADLKLRVGEHVAATVKTIEEKGAIVEVQGVEAYLPIRELASERVNRVEDVVKVGDILTVEVIQFFPKEWRMTVSLSKVTEKSQRKEFEEHLKDNVSANQSLADLFEKYKK